MNAQFERTVTFQPAFDKRHPDPNKNDGVGAMRIRFVLKGPKGAMQFVVSGGMYLPHVADELWNRHGNHNPFKTSGWDIGYHSPVPQYEGQEPMEGTCDVLGCPCYYDGTSLGAEEFVPAFLEEGEKAVWAMLEERYNDRFGEEAR